MRKNRKTFWNKSWNLLHLPFLPTESRKKPYPIRRRQRKSLRKSRKKRRKTRLPSSRLRQKGRRNRKRRKCLFQSRKQRWNRLRRKRQKILLKFPFRKRIKKRMGLRFKKTNRRNQRKTAEKRKNNSRFLPVFWQKDPDLNNL